MNKLELDKYFLRKEDSLKVRDLGFNEPCIFYFDDFGKNFGNITCSNDGDYVKSSPKNTMLPRPSYDQVFDWLQDSCDLDYEIVKDHIDETYSFLINSRMSYIKNYKTKSEAKEACLYQMLQVYEEKLEE